MRKCAWAVGLLVVAGIVGCADAWRSCRSPHEDAIVGASRATPGFGFDEIIVVERTTNESARQDDAPRGGQLRVRRGEREVPLPLKHTDVKATVALAIGSVAVTQQYHNPYDEKIEAVYVFPLPENAAVRDFVMTIGERRIRGVIREREEARKIYLDARRRGHVASLLTQERPNVFTQSVANIEPGKQIDVTIQYFHTLKYAEGEYEFWFPMVVGPRFNPPGHASPIGAAPRDAGGASDIEYLAPDEISAHDIALEVDLDAGLPIREIASPTHAIALDRPGEGRARVTLKPGDRIPNRDFVLRWRVADAEPRAALAIHRDDRGGYFTLMLTPPRSLSDVPRRPREMVFVLDCSGSMEGYPLTIAKRALERCLRRLGPQDTFQVVRFSDQASAMGDRPVPATPENVTRGLRYVSGLTSEGGTMMEYGIRAALEFPHDPARFRIVSFMTDGYIGNEEQILGLIRRHLGGARVFSFGIGSAVNRYLIEGMARAGRGVATVVLPGEPADRPVDELYRRLENPALTDVKVDWGTCGVTDVFPDPIPDLFVGRPVIVTGRFAGKGRATVRVSGRLGTEAREIALEVDLDAPAQRHEALAAVWARAKIEHLCDRAAAESSESLAKEITDVALAYGLVSDHTAFVAVDALTRTAGTEGTTVRQAVPVPKGVKYETTVSEK